EVADRQANLDRVVKLLRRIRRDHDLDRVAVRIIDERRQAVGAGDLLEYRRVVTGGDEALDDLVPVRIEERQEAEARRFIDGARNVRPIRHASRELDFGPAGPEAGDVRAAADVERLQLLEPERVSVELEHFLGLD